MSSRSVVHIGPPKTATTSIQNSLLPRLGRPYLIKPDWIKALTKSDSFTAPKLPSNVVISDESLGEFNAAAPAIIAARLASLLPDAIVIYVARDPVELFKSYYRQKILNTVSGLSGHIANGHVPPPMKAADYLNLMQKFYSRQGIGFFATIDIPALRAAFTSPFQFVVLDYALLAADQPAFVRSFCAACGVDAEFPIVQDNISSLQRLNKMLLNAPDEIPKDFLERWRADYEKPLLSTDQEAHLRNFSQTR